MPLLEGRLDSLLTRALDALAFRQRITAHNLANVNTPGYKRATLPFEAWLRQAYAEASPGLSLARTHSGHLLPKRREQTQPSVVIDRSTSLRNDGNNVDIERESAQLVQDALTYQALIAQVNRRLAALRSVINDGRR